MAESLILQLPDSAATAALGAALARALLASSPPRLVIYLEGELGAGKTALTRAVLAGLGHAGRVPSPTYTLVEPYRLARFHVLHVDLYRLQDPAELDHLGLADELGPGSVLLVEWPSRGTGRLPAPDIICQLTIEGSGRLAVLTPGTDDGGRVISQLRLGLSAGF